MTTSFNGGPGVDVITTAAEIPTLGSLAINAFVLHGEEPLLVDTGTVAGGTEFMNTLESVIDPLELRWIWLTHTDFDHIGSLGTLLELNSSIRVITTFLGVGIMGLSSTPLPMDRVHLVNPGQTVMLGDRRLTAVRPPVFDNPITAGFVDDRTGALFSSDCFGALLPGVPEDASDLDSANCHLRTSQMGHGRLAVGARRRPGRFLGPRWISGGLSSPRASTAATCLPPPDPCSTCVSIRSPRYRTFPVSKASIRRRSKRCSPVQPRRSCDVARHRREMFQDIVDTQGTRW
jgi:hypothetical protein